MATAFVQGAADADLAGSGATSITVNASSTVPLAPITAGSLVVAFVKWEGGDTTCAISGFEAGDKVINVPNESNLLTQMFYQLVAPGGATGITATFGASRTFRRMLVLEFSYAGVASLMDQIGDDFEFGNSFTTPGIDITGIDTVAVAGAGEYVAENFITEAIGGVAADGVVDSGGGFTAAWYRLISSAATGVTASAQYANGQFAGANLQLIAFGITGGGVTSKPRNALLRGTR